MMRIHIDGETFFMRKIRMKSKNSRRIANEYEQKEARQRQHWRCGYNSRHYSDSKSKCFQLKLFHKWLFSLFDATITISSLILVESFNERKIHAI